VSEGKPESATERYRRLRAERLAGPTRYLDPAARLAEDVLWRGLTREGEMRLLVARTTATTAEAAARLGCSPEVAALLAEFMTASLLARSTLNPEAQLQISVANPGSAGRLLADVWPGEQGMRASVANPGATSSGDGALVADGVMQVVRSRGQREPYRSSTLFLAGGLEKTMMEYLLHSEQILSFLRLEVSMGDDGIAESVGFLVQAMPEGSRADLERLVRNLEVLPPLAGAMTPADPDGRAWAEGLLAGFRWDQCARERVRFACRCSRDRVLALLASLPRDDLSALIESGEPAETTCEFCRQVFRVGTAELRGLLSQPH
jgi:molecular chaperone Hsp33